MRSRCFSWFALLFFAAALLAAHAFADRGLPAIDGITNFGKVGENLYRGAQPDAAGIEKLKHLGIKTIINLRLPKEGTKIEAAEASANGITYTNMPLKGVGRPKDADISAILATIESLPGPVFVHCEHGCDRTGTVIACYRIRHDKWTTKAALKEAGQYGMSELERGMRSFVVDFGSPRKTN